MLWLSPAEVLLRLGAVSPAAAASRLPGDTLDARAAAAGADGGAPMDGEGTHQISPYLACGILHFT